MHSTKEKVSYCIGLETGKQLKHQFADMDLECLKKGFTDAVLEMTPALQQEEVHSILSSLQQQVQSQQKHYFSKIAEENKRQSELFFNENKTKDDIYSLPSGLQYKVLSPSSSPGKHPTILDIVKIHYRGCFLDGRIFDSTYQREEPAVFPLSRVIAGWAEILQLMSVGDKWQVFIPPYLAYGEMGFGREIAPNTALVFEIELLEINENVSN